MQKKPEIVVFAGPNGSGKSTVTKLAKVIHPYINADDIKNSVHCSDLEAAQTATEMREKCVKNLEGFTFETASRIFKKRKSEVFFWENELWTKKDIEKLTGITQD